MTGTGAHGADGSDFAGGVLPSATLTFSHEESSKTMSFGVSSDLVVEFDEGLVLTLSAPSSGLDLVTAMAGTIVNDRVSVASISVQAATMLEGNFSTTAFTFTVSRDQPSVFATQTADWGVGGSGAHAADVADFCGAFPSGTVSFAQGETNKTITALVCGDMAMESNEDFAVSLSNLSSRLIAATASGTGVILSEDTAVVSITTAWVVTAEGNNGTTPFTFTVDLDRASDTSQSASWAVSGTAVNAADAADFGGALPSGTLTFAPGETSKTVVVSVTGDSTIEFDEGFNLSLSNPSLGLTLDAASALGTIQNDDIFATVTTHDDAYIVLEGQSLTIAASVGVLLNDQSASTASLLSGPAHGILQLVGSGYFTYTPAAGFQGIDSFTYQAGNNGSSLDEAQATIHVVPVTVGVTTTLDLLSLTADEQIAATYVAFFGRAADAGGQAFWVGEFVRGLPVQGPAMLFANIASSFGISEEAKALYPFLTNPFGASDGQISAFLESVYDNLFNRASDAAGLSYWTGQIKQTLQAGQFVGSILVNIIGGAQDSAAGLDITTLMGKVAVSLAFVHEQQEHGTVWAGAADVAAATALVDPVGSDQLSVLVGVRNAETLIAAHA